MRRLGAFRLVPERAKRVFQSRRWPIETSVGRNVFPSDEGRMERELRCPVCGKAGMASLCQDEAAETPTVQRVSDGFKIVDHQLGSDFQCETCGVPVVP